MLKKAIWVLITLGSGLMGFERFYGGDSLDYGNWIIEDSNRNLIVAGTTNLYTTTGFDFYIVKTNYLGDTIWTRTFGGANIDDGTSVVQCPDGGYVVVGSSNSFNAEELFDIYIVKVDTNGAIGWVKLYGSGEDDYAANVIKTIDNGFAITGTYNYYPDYSLGYYVGDAYLIKTDAVGDTLWTKHYGGSDDDAGQYVAQTRDGGYIIAGYTYSFGPGTVDTSNIYLIKTNIFGTIQWQKGIDCNHSFDYGFWACQEDDGGYTIIGDSYFPGRNWDAIMLKTDSLGNPLWYRTFGDTSQDICFSATKTTNKNYILVGQTSSFGANWIDLYVVKTDSIGNLLWQKKFGGPGIDRGYSVIEASNGGYIITGLFGGDTLRSLGDLYILKIDTGGVVVEVRDAKTMKPLSLFLNVYPNPFNSALMLEFTLGATVEIYNTIGDRIAQITSERLWIPPAGLSGGMYFVKAKLGKEEIVKRVIYMK